MTRCLIKAITRKDSWERDRALNTTKLYKGYTVFVMALLCVTVYIPVVLHNHHA